MRLYTFQTKISRNCQWSGNVKKTLESRRNVAESVPENFEILGHNCENYTFFIYVQQVRVLNRAGTGASRLNSLDLELTSTMLDWEC